MSETNKSELSIKESCSTLQLDKSTQSKTKICYYLDLSKNDREKHQLSKSERLVLRKNSDTLNSKIERCVLDKTKLCKKECRAFEGQSEKDVICRNRCNIDEKKPCIRFEDRSDFSSTLRTKIKKRPWENHQKCIAQTSQCYCGELNKLINQEKETVKSNRTGLSDGKPLSYQDGIKLKSTDKNKLTGQFLKTFQIQYEIPLSLTARSILTSFTNKYIYYAIDDILYLLDSNRIERDNLLSLLYSSMLSLHNDFSVNFFDIWIDSVYLNENFETNRFLKNQNNKFTTIPKTTITLKLHYFTRTIVKKSESIW
jgi:hypothetical protein